MNKAKEGGDECGVEVGSPRPRCSCRSAVDVTAAPVRESRELRAKNATVAFLAGIFLVRRKQLKPST